MAEDRNPLARGWKKLQLQIGQARQALANPQDEDGPQLPADDLWKDLWQGGAETSSNLSASSSPSNSLGGQASIPDGTAMESQVLAYEELGKIAKCIAKDISGLTDINTLVIHNEHDLAGLAFLQWFLMQARILRDQYSAIASSVAFKAIETAEEGITPWSTYIDLFKQAINLLTVDIEVSNQDVSVDEAALASQLILHLPKEFTVYFPRLAPVLAFATSEEDQAQTKIQTALADVRSARRDAVRATTNDSSLQPLIQSTDAAFDALQADLLKRDPQTGVTPLAVILRAQALLTVFGRKGGLLFLKVARAGGSTRITRSLRALFKGPKFEYTGAGVVTYFVFDSDGVVRLARTLYSHSGFTAFKPPAQISNGNNLPEHPLTPRPSRSTSSSNNPAGKDEQLPPKH